MLRSFPDDVAGLLEHHDPTPRQITVPIPAEIDEHGMLVVAR